MLVHQTKYRSQSTQFKLLRSMSARSHLQRKNLDFYSNIRFFSADLRRQKFGGGFGGLSTSATVRRRWLHWLPMCQRIDFKLSTVDAQDEVDGLSFLLESYGPSHILHGWLRGSVVERRSLAGVLSLSCAWPVADGWPLMWVNRPLWVNQPGQLSLSSLRGR